MKPTKSRILFCVCNYFFLTAVTITCILPMWHQLVISLSDNNYASAGLVTFWPKNFTLDAYAYLLEDSSFFRSLNITVQRLVLGIAINMGLCVLTAYPLSKSNDRLHFRTLYVWYFAVTMFIGGGLIPTYVIVTKTGLINSLWALVVPSGLAVGNMVMMLNFFRGVPTALEESAVLDGAGHIRTLLYVYLPVSTPSLATILLFTMVGHWNDWFSGFIYINWQHIFMRSYAKPSPAENRCCPLQSQPRGSAISVEKPFAQHSCSWQHCQSSWRIHFCNAILSRALFWAPSKSNTTNKRKAFSL